MADHVVMFVSRITIAGGATIDWRPNRLLEFAHVEGVNAKAFSRDLMQSELDEISQF
jgi:hypothetical protein